MLFGNQSFGEGGFFHFFQELAVIREIKKSGKKQKHKLKKEKEQATKQLNDILFSTEVQ